MKIIIENFTDDLNYRQIILYIGNVDKTELFKKLKSDMLNHLSRFDNVVRDNLMFIENCDLQDLSSDIASYLDDYTITPLYFDGYNYYINIDLNGLTVDKGV